MWAQAARGGIFNSPFAVRQVMDFDQLHTFLEIVRLKSFSKAAQTCYRTQPAISAQVRQLEQELRADLFERFGSKISLTTAGRIFADYAEQMLALRKQVQDAIAELESNPRGELVIAANEATCIYVLPTVFSEYQRLFPQVQMQVLRSYGSRVVEAVMENSADFGLTQLPVEEKRLQVVNVHRDEIRMIVPADHPLAQHQSVLPNDTLRDRGAGDQFPGALELPRGDRGGQAEGDFAGAGAGDSPAGADLPQGQGAFQSSPGLH
jgi:DNA-binding transcriptional LysR family regulator